MALSARHEEVEPAREVALGPIALVVGALLAIAGLWAPWYRLDLPDGFFSDLAREGMPGDSLGVFQLLASGIDDLERAGRLQADAWEVLTYSDIAVVGLAGVALLAVVLTVIGQVERFPADAVTVAGLALVGIVLMRLVNPPGPTGMLAVMWGPWLTLGGGALIVVGARLAFR